MTISLTTGETRALKTWASIEAAEALERRKACLDAAINCLERLHDRLRGDKRLHKANCLVSIEKRKLLLIKELRSISS